MFFQCLYIGTEAPRFFFYENSLLLYARPCVRISCRESKDGQCFVGESQCVTFIYELESTLPFIGNSVM